MIKRLLFLLLLGPLVAMGQKEIQFKTYMSPNTEYNMNVKSKNNFVITYDGPVEFLEDLYMRGVRNPTVMEESTAMNAKQISGEMDEEGRFPIRIVFVSSEKSDGKPAIPNGTIMYGSAVNDGPPHYDSIVSDEMPEDVKMQVLVALQEVFSQVNFPDRKMKKGESFTDTSNLTFPIGEINFDMKIITNYTLKKIGKTEAQFDIDQDVIMNMEMKDIPGSAEGQGKGRMTFSMAQHYMTAYKLDMEINMKVVTDEFNIMLEQKTTSEQEIEIISGSD